MKDNVVEAAEIARSFFNYAIEQGMHEVGIDPVKILTDEILDLERSLERKSAQLEIATDAMRAAISKAEWQARTNAELNQHMERIAELEGQLRGARMETKVGCYECASSMFGECDQHRGGNHG